MSKNEKRVVGKNKNFTGTATCMVCGKETSNCGFAHVSHLRSHVRRGELIEVFTGGGTSFKLPKLSEKTAEVILNEPIHADK